VVFDTHNRVRRYKETLTNLGLYDQVVSLTRELVGELEGYWENVARTLGKLEGMSQYFTDKPEAFRLTEMFGEWLDVVLNTFITLRSDYSEVSHQFMRTVFFGSFGMGLSFMGMVCGIDVSNLRRIATKKVDKSRHIENLYNTVDQAIKALYANTSTLNRIVSLISQLNTILREADLDMPWDMGDVYDASFRLSQMERDILMVLEELRSLLDEYYRSMVMEPY
jgi:hypothetical protein